MPNWLRQFSGWEDTPEWLLRLIEQSEGPLSFDDLDGSLEEMGFDATEVFSSREEREQEEPPALAGVEPEGDDWFSDLGGTPEGGPAAPSELATPVDEGAPDWMTGLGEGVPASAEPPEVQDDQEAEAPDWLTDLDELPPLEEAEEADWLEDTETEELVEAPAEEAVEEPAVPQQDLPDWLSGLGADVPVTDSEARAFDGEGVPDWLSGLDADVPSVDAQAEVEPGEATVPAEEGAPDWLSGIASDVPEDVPEEAAPDWLSGIASDVPEEVPEEAAPPEDGVPDWLGGLDVEEEAAPAEEGAPDWLSGIASDVPEEAPEEAAPVEEGPPDWLSGLDAEVPSEEAAAVAPDAEETQDEGLPAWLAAIDMSSPGAEVTDEALTAALADTAGLPSVEEEAELPDWLSDVEDSVPQAEGVSARVEEELAPAQPAEEAPDLQEGEEAPDWLQDMGEVAAGPQPVTQKGVTAWLTEVQDMPVPEEEVSEAEAEQEPEAMPEWLQAVDAGEEEGAGEPAIPTEMPDWLREMPIAAPTQEEGAPAEPALPPEDVSMPAWMQDLQVPTQEAPTIDDVLGLPAEGEAAAVETPAWVAELRGEQAEPPEEALPVETSGPLAGLRGVLNPEPLLAIVPKSQYRPLPPIPETHQVEAQLVEQALEPVSQPVRVSRSHGRRVMASLGRWLLYVVVCATVVVSPLRGVIVPVDLLETQSFVNAINALSDGGEVLLVIDYDASLDGELTPQTRAIIWHLLEKNMGIVTVSFTPQGLIIARDLLLELETAVEGEQYVNLGYLPPHPASMQAFTDNPFGGAALWEPTLDAAQTPLGQRVGEFADLDLIVTVSGDRDHVRWWVEQVGSQRDIDIVAGVSASIAPYVQPYYAEKERGQIKGMLVGLAAVPHYEQLTGAQVVPSSWESYVVLANVQILLAVVVVLGAASSLLRRSPRKAPTKARRRRTRAKAPADGDE